MAIKYHEIPDIWRGWALNTEPIEHTKRAEQRNKNIIMYKQKFE